MAPVHKPPADSLATTVPEAAKRAAPFFEEVGEGSLFVGSNGQGTDALEACPVARKNRPGVGSRVDTAHLSLYSGYDIFQWWGRKSDGMFHPFGKLLRLTAAGFRALEAAEQAAPTYSKPYIANLRKALKARRTDEAKP